MSGPTSRRSRCGSRARQIIGRRRRLERGCGQRSGDPRSRFLRSAKPGRSLARLPPARGEAGSALPTFEGVSRATGHESLLVRPAGTRRGARRLRMETEAVVAEALAQFYETLQKPSVIRLRQEVRRLCRARGLKSPGWHTLRARIDAIDPAELTRAREGAKAARDRFSRFPANMSPSARMKSCRSITRWSM